MDYIKRKIEADLKAWRKMAKHKPVLLRGARQVGKSSTVRELGKSFKNFVEVNFEKDEQKLHIKAIFERDLDVHRICDELSLVYRQPIEAGKTLLFLDEIQACIPAISALRYFYEDYPDLHIIAAGSLLEFALAEIPSFGVGRITSLFMYPFSFDEFLAAMNYEDLNEQITQASPENPLSDSVFHTTSQLFLKFTMLGGMPEVVATHAQGGSLLECQQVLEELITAYYNDFTKYKKRINPTLLREVFLSIIRQTGGKFTYKNASDTANTGQIKESLELLTLAGLVYPITHSAANGIPLGAESNPKYRKFMIFDTGIYQNLLGLTLNNFASAERLMQVNKGALAEMFVGLEMLKSLSNRSAQSLYYWQREVQGSSAEVDFVIQREQQAVPVEVKAGSRGSMQSLFLFLKEKNAPYGIRCAFENFAEYQSIKAYPLFAAGQISKEP